MIAISYRREDSLPITGRLYDRMLIEFGKSNVFMDFDSIPYGVDFRAHIQEMISQSKVVVAMIGPGWAGRRRFRGRRIDDVNDFVRLEITHALELGLPLIPVLINDTPMPKVRDLPVGLEPLAYRNALTLDAGRDFHHHADRLIAAVKYLLEQSRARVATPAQASVEASRPAQIAAPPLQPTDERPARRRMPIMQTPPAAEKKAATVELKREEQAPDEKMVKPLSAPPPKEDRQRERSINLDAQIAALGGAFIKFRHALGGALRAAKSGTSASLRSTGYGIRNFLRTSGEGFRRRQRVITISAIWIVALASSGGAIYWGVRSGTFKYFAVQTGQLFKPTSASKIEPKQPPAGVVQRESESPVAPISPLPATAAPAVGTLTIDSTPQGEAYEVVDSNSKHHLGKTPETLEDLPSGYAQVIFRREGFSDHTSYVWIAPNTKPSVSWNFPEDYRIKSVPRVESSPTAAPIIANASIPPASPPAAPATNTTWQERITDFVRQFVIVNQSQDANATANFYAPKVDYFGNRGKDHAFILHDVQMYNLKWPARRDSIDGDVQVEEKVPDQQYRANFKLNLYAEDPKANDWSKGQVAMTIDINVIEGAPRIVAVNQKSLQRQNGKGKGPRPPDMPAPEPPGPIKPTKLTKVIVKKFGFSALVPTEMFPDAEAKLADGVTDRLTSLKGCATVVFSAPHENVQKVYDDYVRQFQSAPEHRTVDYKVMKDTWFVVSGSSKTTGYYVKGVRHGDDVFVMDLAYVGGVCRIPASLVAQMSHAFNGN